MLRLGLALALLLAPAAALGETCTSLSTFRWTAFNTTVPATQWGGCTPTADDDFIAASGHVVTVDGDVTLDNAAGSVTVASGGGLRWSSGTLVPGAELRVQAGGLLDWQGRVLAICELILEPDFTVADPIVTTNCNAQALAATTDSLVYLDEDPEGGLWNGETVNVGPGRIPGARNLSLNRWAWYDILGLVGGAIEYDLDSGTYAASPEAPYFGTRGNPLLAAGPVPATDYTATRQPGGRATELAIDTAAFGASVVSVNADLGSYYVYYPENAAAAHDPTLCAGEITKIVHSEEGGATDRVMAIADAARCDGAPFFITPGARRGDLVALVRPAIVDGFFGGANNSVVRIESGAEVRIRWARFTRLGALDAATVSPTLARHCNVCLYQGATASAALPIRGWLLDTEISFFESLTTDTAVLSWQSAVAGQADLRFPDAGLLDLRGFAMGRLHIHDARDDGTGGGSHLVYDDGVRGAYLNGARLERSSDDLIGGNIVGNTTGTATTAGVNTVRVERILAYEAIAEQDNGQQGFEFAMLARAEIGGVHSYARHQGYLRAKDIVSIGTYKASTRLLGSGMRVERLVDGGQRFSDDAAARPFEISLATGNSPLVLFETYRNKLRNSLLMDYAEDGASSVFDPFAVADVEHSVWWGKEQANDATDVYQGLQGCRGSFLYHQGLNTYMIEGLGTTDYIGASSRAFLDCALVSASAHRLSQNWTNSARAYTVTANRLAIYATGAFASGGTASAGCLGSVPNEVGAALRARGVYCNTTVPGTADFTVSSASPQLADVCYESNDSAADDFDANLGATTATYADLLPDASGELTPGSVVGRIPSRSNGDVCERSKPRQLGLSEIGTAHVMMGSLFLQQLYPTYTSRPGLVKLVGVRGAAGTPSGLPSP
jgi:hypothetical protein